MHRIITGVISRLFTILTQKGFTHWGDVLHITAIVTFASDMFIAYYCFTVVGGFLTVVVLGVMLLIVLSSLQLYLITNSLLVGHQGVINEVLKPYRGPGVYTSCRYLPSLFLGLWLYVVTRFMGGDFQNLFYVTIFGNKIDLRVVMIVSYSCAYLGAILRELVALRIRESMQESNNI